MIPAADATLRLFVALWPDEATRARLQALADAWHWPPGVRRCAPADWHVTLHFLGAVPAARLAALRAALAVPWTPFTLTLTKAQRWPRGLAVLTAAAVPAPLAALHRRLGQALTALALPVERRPLRPHVTLARRAEEAEPPPAVAPLAWPVTAYALVQSTGEPARRYRILQRYAPPATGTIAPPTSA
ncbi:RNA 2',3'-cyclic phosphodiesterase [Tepidimonas sediminis]|uniref:RNA 2',3'-cyclic phosphodiesterase n=1 Tax=Tepidimonas sediminis TaxID=2588941 RepID=A0A554WL41_9BURK|nr:RNA 2',3'-cyclic phosphodiesterase [Tepidimonas sediminis]TSE24311.1 RNA 2',3'-cyclic phosphodiesterase [Tepidimonas sediminis]